MIGLREVTAGGAGVLDEFGSILVGRIRPYPRTPNTSAKAVTYEATVAARVRRSKVENATSMSPSVRAPSRVMRKQYSTWSSSTPPNKKTRLKIGTDSNRSRTTNDIEARSLPQMIEKGAMRVTKSRSIVWRSRSPLMAPAVSAGAVNAVRIHLKTTRYLY